MGRRRPSESLVEYFDRTAGRFAANYESAPEFHERRAVWRCAIERVLPGVPHGALCLDLGCGDGSLSRWVAAQGRPVVGLDQSDAMLALARRRAGEEGLGPCAVYHHASLPLDPAREAAYEGTVGLIVCSSVLEYVTDPPEVLAQCRRLLMPGGTLLVSLANRDSLYRIAQRALHGLFAWTDSYLRYQRHQYSLPIANTLLTRLGFRVIDAEFFALPFHRYVATIAGKCRGRRMATMILLAARNPGGTADPRINGGAEP